MNQGHVDPGLVNQADLNGGNQAKNKCSQIGIQNQKSQTLGERFTEPPTTCFEL